MAVAILAMYGVRVTRELEFFPNCENKELRLRVNAESPSNFNSLWISDSAARLIKWTRVLFPRNVDVKWILRMGFSRFLRPRSIVLLTSLQENLASLKQLVNVICYRKVIYCKASCIRYIESLLWAGKRSKVRARMCLFRSHYKIN